ncbi:hypothetical protein [Arthrobacter cryoconiti]|uniref:Uncharacterized protein n=1 Tax=Arthrobacter cryoconiti TaxID=748907 RepID=A0ABV8R1F5_9MICC|nr:hypothetical protein [Arthrobacter cryoconiti]
MNNSLDDFATPKVRMMSEIPDVTLVANVTLAKSIVPAAGIVPATSGRR